MPKVTQTSITIKSFVSPQNKKYFLNFNIQDRKNFAEIALGPFVELFSFTSSFRNYLMEHSTIFSLRFIVTVMH